MNGVIALVALPPLCGLVILLLRDFRVRKPFVLISTILQAAIALNFTLSAGFGSPLSFSADLPWLETALLAGELGMATLIAIIALRRKRLLSLLLAIAQGGIAIYGERAFAGIESYALFRCDQISLLMILVVAFVGGLILLYAAGYMKTWQEEHGDVPDRRRFFFFVVFAFIGAMYGLVLANDLRLMLFFWEITTLCSFFLIGYGRSAEADESAFRALSMNLAGGIAFALGIVLLAQGSGSVELDGLATMSLKGGALAHWLALPAALLAFAGIVKAAQLPFTPWLLGAMVAPTPVSALLHSSTMVKAGVYLLLRLAPLISGSLTGYIVAFIGAFTFLAGSFAAISQRNAKRVLAFSTVSNLGLIVACVGFGTYQLVWVAFFLILYHAVAKSLLFLCVGTVSIGLGGSLDIEDMGGLATSMPRVALMMVVGISAMFIAPFGMLVSKWAAMEAFITMNSVASPLMIVILAYGSSATLFFWTKWLGILIRTPDPEAPRGLLESKVSTEEFLTGGALAILAIAACVSFPIVSKAVVEPYLLFTFGRAFGLDRDNAVVTVFMIVMTVAVPGLLLAISTKRKANLSTAYMSGRVSGADLSFKGSKGIGKSLETRGYYLERFFGEKKIMGIGTGTGILLVIILVGTALL
jgi:ech hydrogenase subunit A